MCQFALSSSPACCASLCLLAVQNIRTPAVVKRYLSLPLLAVDLTVTLTITVTVTLSVMRE